MPNKRVEALALSEIKTSRKTRLQLSNPLLIKWEISLAALILKSSKNSKKGNWMTANSNLIWTSQNALIQVLKEAPWRVTKNFSIAQISGMKPKIKKYWHCNRLRKSNKLTNSNQRSSRWFPRNVTKHWRRKILKSLLEKIWLFQQTVMRVGRRLRMFQGWLSSWRSSMLLCATRKRLLLWGTIWESHRTSRKRLKSGLTHHMLTQTPAQRVPANFLQGKVDLTQTFLALANKVRSAGNKAHSVWWPKTKRRVHC